MGYKRNQVEDAIVRTLGAEGARVEELKLRMKRLLVTDRRLRRSKRSDDKAGHRYAFYSQKPQGSGVEVMFSDYEAFALLAALIVLEHGIPQAKVVSILREIRSDFEAAHRDILQKDPKELFDQHSIRAMARPGMFAVDNTSPVFLTL
jgi:predicted DNA-binding transcriptional regulator YafY